MLKPFSIKNSRDKRSTVAPFIILFLMALDPALAQEKADANLEPLLVSHNFVVKDGFYQGTWRRAFAFDKECAINASDDENGNLIFLMYHPYYREDGDWDDSPYSWLQKDFRRVSYFFNGNEKKLDKLFEKIGVNYDSRQNKIDESEFVLRLIRIEDMEFDRGALDGPEFSYFLIKIDAKTTQLTDYYFVYEYSNFWGMTFTVEISADCTQLKLP